VLHDEKIGRTQAKHDDGVPIETVTKAPPPTRFEIFLDGHGIDITNATAFEMTLTRVMNGMATSPRLVGCQREHADHSTSPIIRQAMAEERAVTAIMLDHEETYEKPCSGHRNNKSEPVAEAQGGPH
jgi:hypothetical protein